MIKKLGARQCWLPPSDDDTVREESFRFHPAEEA